VYSAVAKAAASPGVAAVLTGADMAADKVGAMAPLWAIATSDGKLAPPDMVKRVGIGTRVRMVFSDVSPDLSLPQWTIDESARQPDKPWQYPHE